MGREGIVEREGHTVVILGEPKDVLHPYSKELVLIVAEASNIISSMLWGCAEF